MLQLLSATNDPEHKQRVLENLTKNQPYSPKQFVSAWEHEWARGCDLMLHVNNTLQ